MYSTGWVNQFKIKGRCIEFVTNTVSPQGNNVKIKLNLKVEEICRDCSLIFCEINDNAPSLCLILSEVHLPCDTPDMECFAKIVNG